MEDTILSHKCNLKQKLAELAEEVKAREDDVRHSPSSLKAIPKHMHVKITGKDGCRKTRVDETPIKTPSIQRLQSTMDRQPDVARSSLNPGERERQERLAEINALRRRREFPHDVEKCPTILSIPSQSIQNSKSIPQKKEFKLPPPPDVNIDIHESSMENKEEVVETVNMEENLQGVEPNSNDLMDVDTSVKSPPSLKEQVVEPAIQPVIEDSKDSSDATMQAHEYYTRPKFGTKRTLPMEETTTQLRPILRQRSVSFQAPPGTAPGDTASDMDSLGDGSDSHLPDQTSRSSCNSQPMVDNSEDAGEESDSELSALLDNVLEEAAAEASFHSARLDKENHPASAAPFSNSTSDSELSEAGACSDPESADRVRLVRNGSLRGSRQRRAQSSHRRSGSRRRSGASNTGDAQSCLERRHSSRRTAAALVDENLTRRLSFGSRDSGDRFGYTNASVSADLESQRRVDRLIQLPKLLDVERRLILQASMALQQSTSGNGALNDKLTQSATKRSRFGFTTTATGNSSTTTLANGTSLGFGSVPYLEANRTLLIACQRRQVLMEELSLLHRGSPVLVPGGRKDPIRARLKLSGVRLSLKQFQKPGDPSSGGGFVVLPVTETALLPPSVTQYHLLAILKCRGEGRLYHTSMVTLVRASDMPVGTVRPVTYVDLPAAIEIVPLRPDFLIYLEVYCMRVGPESTPSVSYTNSPMLTVQNRAAAAANGPSRHRRAFDPTMTDESDAIGDESDGSVGKRTRSKYDRAIAATTTPFHTPRSGRVQTPSSLRYKSGALNVLAACLPAASLLSPAHSGSHLGDREGILGQTKPTAFTLLSSVEIRYHDDLLLGQLRSRDPIDIERYGAELEEYDQMPLRLARLPRSTPLSGAVGLVQPSVRLEARVLHRGFLNIFEEVGGLGIWRRYWCQLRADRLQLWRYPEDEQKQESKPVARLDLRHVAAPRAVPAPRLMCARAHAIYMRSLRSVDPDWVSTAAANSASETSESILFRASEEYGWLEQRHLLCADSGSEQDNWIRQLNECMEALKHWMPEHMTHLARYDSHLIFNQPVSTRLAAFLLHGDRNV